MQSITLPLPPTVNHCYGHVRSRKYIKPEGKAYREQVCWMIKGAGIKPIAGRVGLKIIIHQKTRLNIDLDNRQKFLIDSLQAAGLFENDSQVDYISIARGEIDKDGRCEVDFWEIPSAP